MVSPLNVLIHAMVVAAGLLQMAVTLEPFGEGKREGGPWPHIGRGLTKLLEVTRQAFLDPLLISVWVLGAGEGVTTSVLGPCFSSPAWPPWAKAKEKVTDQKDGPEPGF